MFCINLRVGTLVNVADVFWDTILSTLVYLLFTWKPAYRNANMCWSSLIVVIFIIYDSYSSLL